MKPNRCLIFLFLFTLALTFACTGRKIDSQLRKAEELKGTRKFEEALSIYKLITDRYPDDPRTAEAFLKMGDLYFYTLGKPEEAMNSYSKVMGKWPLSESACEAALKRAEIFRSRDNPGRAIGEYEWALKYFPDYENRHNVRLQIAEEYLDMKDPYQASIELEELLKNDEIGEDVRAKALFDLGESYLFLKEYEKALKSLDTLIRKFPDVSYGVEARLRMIECLEKLERPEEVARSQKELVRLYPNSEEVKKKVTGSARREEKKERPDLGQKFKELHISRQGHDIVKFKVEIAETPLERARGLMFRQSIPEDQGMWFIFGKNSTTPFWMQNTYVSLDIIFVDHEYQIVSIARKTKPMSEKPIPSKKPYRYVLEVVAGSADRFKLETGDKIDLQ